MLALSSAALSFNGALPAVRTQRARGAVMETKEDLKLPEAPENYGRELTKAFEAASEKGVGISVSVCSAMGHEQVMSHKELAEGK